MGVIQRQSIKNSIVNYIGVAIGAVSTVFIYPLSIEAYGLARFLIDSSMLLMPFVMIGMNALVIRYFPIFKDDNTRHHGFLPNIILFALVGMVLFSITIYIFREKILDFYHHKKLIGQFIFYIIPLTCLIGICELLTQFASNFQRIVVPGLFNVLIKVTLPVLILLVYHNCIGIGSLVQGIVFNYVLVFLSLILYLNHLGQLNFRPNFTFVDKKLAKEMGVFAGYGVIGLLGSILAARIDTSMIGTILDEELTGVYSILLFMASVIDIPRISIEKVAGPIVSQSWKNNDLGHIELLYKKTSINQIIVGSLLFIGIYSNLDSLFEMMPRGEILREYKSVVLFVGLAKLVDMATGINHHIIAYSKYFRFNFLAIIFMAVLNVVMNIILIPIYGIMGAALASFVSIILYNLIKFLLILKKIGIQPFTKNTIQAVFFGCLSYLLADFVSWQGSPIVEIVLKSIIILFVYGGLVYFFRISSDINILVDNYLKNIRSG